MQKVPLAAGEHARQDGPGRIDMGHDVYFPDSLPAFVGDFDAAAAAGYSCVGAKKIDRPAGGDRFVHKADKICFDAHVGGDGASADLTRNQPGTVNVDVSDDNCPGALGGKAAAQGPADAVCSTGYDDSFAGKLLSRIVLLPLVAGISYEIIRYSAKHPNSLLRIVTLPGLLLQKITTKPPDDTQVEIAIRALEEALTV